MFDTTDTTTIHDADSPVRPDHQRPGHQAVPGRPALVRSCAGRPVASRREAGQVIRLE